MENTFHIQWHITDFCNLRCRHCYQSEFAKDSELSFDCLQKIFENITYFASKNGKKLVIDITGGEPFLYKHWEPLISMINQSKSVIKTGIITNGLLVDASKIHKLERLKNFSLKISAEGLTKESYEYIRGVNTYNRFIETCGLLKDVSFEKTLMFTLFSGSLSQIDAVVPFMNNYNLQTTIFERFIPWGRGALMKEKLISLYEWREVLKLLCKICRLEDNLCELAPYRGFMVGKEGTDLNLFGAPCIVAKDGIALMPDGSVFPCRRFPLTIGNLKDQSMEEVWKNSTVLEKLKNRFLLKGKCKTCIIDSCFGCRALAYSVTGDFLAEDPLCLIK